MDIEFSKEDLEFQKEVAKFIEENLPTGMELWTKRTQWFDALRKKGGWDIPKWPVEFGGPGFTPTQRYIFDMEMGRSNTPPQLPFGIGMLAPILMNYGSKEQQDRFLPGIRDGSVNWCQGYSEPGAGSDLANLRTKAELSEDGTHYIVNGQAEQLWISLTSDNPALFEGLSLLVKESIRFDRTLYRVQTGPFDTLEQARSFCTNLTNSSEKAIGCLALQPDP